jgi:putative holliday junction resolvase
MCLAFNAPMLAKKIDLNNFKPISLCYTSCMTYIGIDYGSKRVGIAVSDQDGNMAFPHTVLKNDEKLLNSIIKIAEEKNSKAIVVGESKDYHGDDNEIMGEVNEFKKALEGKGFEVFLEPEFLTSLQASHIQGENEMIDASAAAIILQSFLDKRKNTSNDNAANAN